MPLLSGNPNSNGATFPDPSVIGSLGQGLEGIAAGYGNSIENPAQQLGLIRSKPVSVQPGGVPWTPWTPRSDPSSLWVYGEMVPEGIVLTHCFVTEGVSYRPYPLSAVSSVPLKTIITQSVTTQKGKDGKVTVASNTQIKVKKDLYQTPAAAKAVLAASQAFRDKVQGSRMTIEAADTELAAAAAPDLAQAGVDLGRSRLEKRVSKVYISDNEPRKAEIRLVLHDVIAPPTKNGPPQLSASRYELLETLWNLFCRNPHGAAPYKDINTVMSDAARINAENSAGHLVELRSMGLNPYNVETWLTTSFQSQEIPNLDVIVVKISLLEFYSVFETGKPTAAEAPPASTSVAPVAPARPSYLSQAGLA